MPPYQNAFYAVEIASAYTDSLADLQKRLRINKDFVLQQSPNVFYLSFGNGSPFAAGSDKSNDTRSLKHLNTALRDW
jgi:ABC-type Fe3+-hydroxamate transport system substrate-binding protein